jgi:large conductance mechanosensitive channel
MKKNKTKKARLFQEKSLSSVRGFIEFIQSQGVIGLAIGVVMGTSITKIVTAFVTDIINPIIGLFIGKVDLKSLNFQIADAKIMWGNFVNNLIDFLIIALVVYFGTKLLGLNKNNQKK